MKGASQLAPVGIRIPDELKSKIQSRAQHNGRSMNAEIIDIIEKSFSGEDNQILLSMQEQISHLVRLNELREQIIETQGGTIESQKTTIIALESSVSTLKKHIEMLNEHVDFLKELHNKKKPE